MENDFADYGFKGVLHDMDITLFPLYQENNDIKSKGASLTNAATYLLDINLLRDYSIKDLIANTQILGKDVQTITIEHILATKLRTFNAGLKYRRTRDLQDIAFIGDNIEKLGLVPEKFTSIQSRLRDANDVRCAKQLENGNIVRVLDHAAYTKELRTRSV